MSHSAITVSQGILWVIHDAGIFQKYNFDPQIIYIANSPPNIAGVLSGDLAFTVTAGPAAVSAAVEGTDILVLMSFLHTMNDFTLFSNPAIKKPADLKKKIIGVGQPGSADDYEERIVLRKWGLDPDKDVSLLTAGGQPTRLTALQVGRVDASLFQIPTTLRARKAGLNEIASGADFGIDYLGTSIAMKGGMIQKNPSFVQRFVKAFVEGIHYYKTNKEASLRSIAKFTKLSDGAALDEAYNTYGQKFLPRIPYPSIKGIDAILEDLAKRNPKARGVNSARFVDTKFLKDLEDSGFIAQLYGKETRPSSPEDSDTLSGARSRSRQVRSSNDTLEGMGSENFFS